MINNYLNPEDNFLRFTAPEMLLEPSYINISNDIWMLGCLFVEIFSKYKIWDGYSENEVAKQLKNKTLPKLPIDIPEELWGLICDCLSPFHKTRNDIREVINRYLSIMHKLGKDELVERMESKI
jgi:hypothetical protein